MRPISITAQLGGSFRGILPLLLLFSLGAGVSGCIAEPGEGKAGSQAGAFDALGALSGEPPAAIVNGSKLYAVDVEHAAKAQQRLDPGASLSPQDPLFAEILEELIDQRLLALAAQKRGLEDEEMLRRRLAISRERIVSSRLVELHLAETVNETSLRQMYEAQAGLRGGLDEVRARHILVKTEAEIKAVSAKLEAGEAFAKLAKDISLDKATAELGGDLSYFTRDSFAPEFAKVAFSTETGTRSAPFQTTFGWHILEVLDRRKAEAISFEEARGQLLNYMTYSEIENLMRSLREQANIERLLPQQAQENDGLHHASPQVERTGAQTDNGPDSGQAPQEDITDE
jgi:peptidyl-prolyl cis-trans isomerase C